MASHCGPSSNSPDVRQAEEDVAREREAYRYLQPLQDLLAADYSQTPSKPRSSPDRALTAFAQLGCFRLGVRRSFISIIDRRYQYSLAEATRTLSLQKDTVEDEEDSLWLGQTRFPRARTPCEAAAGLLDIPELLAPENKNEVFVVPNLEEHTLWSAHPLVTTRPHGRFYAGVPIVSPNGYAIGAYCVLDDKPRDGLSTADIDFMKDMAMTIMSHLEMVRAKVELDRSQNMVRGLGNFVDGRANLKDWWRNVSHGSSKDMPERSKSSRTTSKQPSRQTSLKDTRNSSLKDEAPDVGPTEVPSPGRILKPRPSVKSLNEPAVLPPLVQEAIDNASNLQEESISADVRCTFQKAAEIIRRSVDVDGAIFLDASVGTFAGLVDSFKSRRNSFTAKSNNTSTSAASTTLTEESLSSSASAEEKPCIVLGRDLMDDSPGDDFQEPVLPLSVTERFLQTLLAKYPKGKIWTYDSEGSNLETISDVDGGVQTADFVNRRGERWRERRAIQKLFPGVRCLALVGLWDPHRSRWFAGSVLWTCSPTRILCADNELSYMTAFGQSIMAEVARIDVKLADKAKATFISSISHELRTPLHGIMGSSECLQSTDLDAFQASLINTIETCGRTLMDTFENLLSFAKINNLMTGSSNRRLSASSKNGSLRNGADSVQTPVDLSILAEEVVETVFAGHEFVRVTPGRNALAMGSMMSPNMTANLTRGIEPINVILDYDINEDWVFNTQAGGWIRVILNLVGNSMKYTERGSVVVRLDAKPLPNSESEEDGEEVEVRLTVTDTGKGMTDEFLRSGAFQAFVQEDALSPGTGLGLSIVKQIISKTLGGTISIQSKKNEGTEIQVVVCMTRATSPVDTTKPSIASVITKVCRDKRVNLISPDGTANQAFVQLCRKWFGIMMRCNPKPEEADIYVIMEEHTRTIAQQLASLPESLNPLAQKPVIVLCKDFVSAHALKSSNATASISCCVEYMSQPFGPNRVAKTLAACFDRVNQHNNTRPLLSRSSSRRNSPARGLGPRPGLNRHPSALSTESRNSNPEIVLYTPSEEVTEASYFPGMKQSPETTKPLPALPPASPLAAPPIPYASVLLVDDNTINLNLLATFMRKQKHSYGTAINGLEALEAYRDAATSAIRNPYDYVLMDINMPVMDGLESTRQIRAFERSAGLRPATIVALTGMASASAQQEAFASGVSLFLTKPVRFKELTRILDGRG